VSVTLDGSGSTDTDGTIVSYEWREGTEVIGSTPVITPSLTLGTHVITLTVTDNDGMQGTDTVSVEVTQDIAGPVISNVSSAVTSSSATVSWTTDENSDSLIRYGTSSPTIEKSLSTLTTSHSIGLSGLTPSTSYVYEVVSKDRFGNTTVDSNGGAYYTLRTNDVAKSLIADIALSNVTTTKGKNKFCTVTSRVKVTNQSGAPLSNALVTGTWSGVYSGQVSGNTGADGYASFVTPAIKGCGTFTWTANNVAYNGHIYDAQLNAETSDTIVAQ
jgi:hypothetical protein